MTANDTMLTIHFADGAELSLSLPKGIAHSFPAAVQRWRQCASLGELAREALPLAGSPSVPFSVRREA